MQVLLQQAGKRFEGRSIIRGVDLELSPGERPAVIHGPNGAGKSTLLKLVAAFLRPSEGKVEHLIDGAPIESERVYRYLSIAAPYLRFPTDMTVKESIRTWQRFRPLRWDPERIPRALELEAAKDRPVRELSSGMEQRLKLGIAFATASPLLLLDEPLTNIDDEGRALYQELLKHERGDRNILICSNDPEQEAPPDHERYRLENGSLRSLS